MNKKRFGTIGEKIAQNYLKNNGYEIIELNYYTKKGEIDIIAKNKDCIIFVEVKTRKNNNFGTPAMAVNYTKKKHIKSVAKIFLYKKNEFANLEIRFDVIEVYINKGKCKINHIKSIM